MKKSFKAIYCSIAAIFVAALFNGCGSLPEPKTSEERLFSKIGYSSRWRYKCDGLQPENLDSMDELYNAFENSKAEYDEFFAKLQEKYSKFNITIVKRNDFKSKEDVVSELKLMEDSERQKGNAFFIVDDRKADNVIYHCRKIYDITNCMVLLDKTDELVDIISDLNSNRNIVRILNYFPTPDELNFSDLSVNVKLSNNLIAEAHFNLKSMIVAKETQKTILQLQKELAGKEYYSSLHRNLVRISRKIYAKARDDAAKGEFPANYPDIKVLYKPYIQLAKTELENCLVDVEAAVKSNAISEELLKEYKALIKIAQE